VVHRIIRSRYTGRWWVGCYKRCSEDGPGRAAAPPSPILAVPNVTAHPSTTSVPITVLLYDNPLLCGFNAAIIGLITQRGIPAHTSIRCCLKSSTSCTFLWQWQIAAAAWCARFRSQLNWHRGCFAVTNEWRSQYMSLAFKKVYDESDNFLMFPRCFSSTNSEQTWCWKWSTLEITKLATGLQRCLKGRHWLIVCALC